MPDEPKLQKLIDSLGKLTAQGKLAWTDTVVEDEFQAALPNYTVAIQKVYADNDWGEKFCDYQLFVRDAEGRVLDETSSSDSGGLSSAVGAALKNLHEAARRKALSVDAALDDLLLSLDRLA